MTEEMKTTTTETTTSEELPCFVRHEDAGGQCQERGSVRVHGLNFCASHGGEVQAGAGLQAFTEANEVFERHVDPRVPKKQRTGIERAFEFGPDGLRAESPSDSDHQRALLIAYPPALTPLAVQRRILTWEEDEGPGYAPVLDTLLDSLYAVYKLIRIAREDGETWLVEILEEERQSVACQAAFALRRSESELFKTNAG